MKIRKSYLAISLAIIAALLVVGAINVQHRTPVSAGSQSLHGGQAVEQLKQQGTYNSLAQAMNAAQYNARPAAGKAFHFANPAQGFSATFAAADSDKKPGLRVAISDTKPQNELSINLTAYGYDRNLSRLKPSGLEANENRVEYLHRES
ncbi:MAG: hypothetical protein ACRD82_20885, partial [Blastocatellia bacterium]